MVRPGIALLLFLASCGKHEETSAQVSSGATAPAVTQTPEPTAEPTKPRKTGVIAERGYESLLHGKRASVFRVTWSWAKYDGKTVVRDVTRIRSRTGRDMAGHIDVFTQATDVSLYRTEEGALLYQHIETRLAGRTDKETLRWTGAGYEVTRSTGPNKESYVIETSDPTPVDVETFLGPRILSGDAKAGATYTMRVLDTGGKRILESELKILGHDDEGPGLKVDQTLLGNTTLWWFAPDGAVIRIRTSDSVTRRADHLGLDDLPRRPATYPITLSADISLPRIFTGKAMVVDVIVDTDETVKPPKIPDNPFTEIVEEQTGKVRLKLKMHDDPEANTALPIAADGFEEYLKPTPLMEVDDAEVKELARSAVGDAKDARTAATRIADYVFWTLRKRSPPTANPSAKEIIRMRTGDCSEHCLLFTTLCRAAGIPARRCSGFVNIGEDWGGHAWCEIWVGKWIGADPTTNEIGTRARYIFCGRQDEPEVRHASINAGRTKIRTRRAEYDDGVIDFEKGELDLTVFSGIRFAKLPEGWRVERSKRGAAILTKEFRLDARIAPDHGYRSVDRMRRGRGGRRAMFGGRPALHFSSPRNSHWVIPLGRQNLTIRATTLRRGGKLPIAEIEKAFAPTLAPQSKKQPNKKK